MIKVIPETKECFCDRCEAKVKNEDDFAGEAQIQIHSRDASGVFVGGHSMRLELCDKCAYDLVDWGTGKDLNKQKIDK